MYLLIGRCPIDEIPVRLCTTREEAEAVATKTSEQDVLNIAYGHGLDTSECFNLSILPFSAAGVPGEYEVLRRFDE